MDDDPNAPGHKISDIQINQMGNNPAGIIKFLSQKKIKKFNIISLISDFGVMHKYLLEKKINRKSNLNFFIYKYDFRKKLRDSNLSNIYFNKLNAANIKKFDRKYIIKPNFGAASRDVNIVNNKKEFLHYKNKFKKKDFIIESFRPGKEFVLDGFVINGKFDFYYLAEKEKTKKSNYLVCHVYKLPKINQRIQYKIKNVIENCLKSFSYNNGPFHAEIIFNEKNNEIHPIEIHARGGGFHIGTKMIERLCNIYPPQLELDLLLKNKKIQKNIKL